MSNNLIHGLTIKGVDGKTKAHPLYWVWHEKKKNYSMAPEWGAVLPFYEWCLANGWESGNSIRRHNIEAPYSPSNCYVHVRGTALGKEKV